MASAAEITPTPSSRWCQMGLSVSMDSKSSIRLGMTSMNRCSWSSQPSGRSQATPPTRVKDVIIRTPEYAWRDRDLALDLNEAYSGVRMMTSFTRVGEVAIAPGVEEPGIDPQVEAGGSQP